MRPPRPPVLGALLAGGASSRFGSPKWRARLDDGPLGARGVLALSSLLDPVVVLSSDPALRELGTEVWPDLETGLGPLGGLQTALHGARRLGFDAVFLLACDLPLVGAHVVSTVVGRWGGEEAVVPLGPRGPEPLCALYALSALPALERFVAEGGRSARGLLDRLDVRWLTPDEMAGPTGLADPFLNVNTEEDLRRAEALLGRRTEG